MKEDKNEYIIEVRAENTG